MTGTLRQDEPVRSALSDKCLKIRQALSNARAPFGGFEKLKGMPVNLRQFGEWVVFGSSDVNLSRHTSIEARISLLGDDRFR